MFFRVIGKLGILALSAMGAIVILTAVAQLVFLAIPGIAPSFSE